LTFRTVIRVLPYKHGMWQIKFEGESESHSVFGNKSTAVEMARGLARKHGPSHLVVHMEDAAIEYEHSYSDDADPHLGEV